MIPRWLRTLLRLLPVAVALVVSACEKVPLLAPSGSTITITAAANTLSANGSTDIIAQVLEPAGTPPHSGTRVTFTTTLGTISPSDAATDLNGRVVVKFLAGTSNGTARITAASGGAVTPSDSAVTIAVGTAAVGRVTLSANPNPISSNGGVSTITANVVDINGNALSAVPVNFSTSAGALSANFVNTNGSGVAQTSLTTGIQATVTATVGVESTGTGGGTPEGSTAGRNTATVVVNVNPVPTVSIGAPTGTLIANSPIVFTLSIQPGTNSTAQIRDVSVNFGDGTGSVNLGAVSGQNLTVQHAFDDDGTYTVRVTVEDTLGGVTSAATVVVIQPQPPLGVTINFTKAGSPPPTTVTFTATVTPGTATVSSYFWDFGDTTSATTTSNQVVHTYNAAAVYTVAVTVTTTAGQSSNGQTAVTVP